ncbi:MAG: hypothetical protein V9H69_06150 [Anaerolineae bacterium]
MSALSPLALLAYLLIFVGLVGSLLPVVPGPVFIWLGGAVVGRQRWLSSHWVAHLAFPGDPDHPGLEPATCC